MALRDLGVDVPELGSRTVSRSRVPLLVGAFVRGSVWVGTGRVGGGGCAGCSGNCGSASTTSIAEEDNGLLNSPADSPTAVDRVS